jgi:hypothetical protein
MEAMRRSSPHLAAEYSLHLAITAAVFGVRGGVAHFSNPPPSQRENRFFLPEDVRPGAHFEPRTVRSLATLSGLELPSVAVDLSAFVNLERLNLRNNKLENIESIGVRSMPQLRVLDVSFNLIKNPLQSVHPPPPPFFFRFERRQIAELFDAMKSIEIVALRGNPIMGGDSDRIRLIGLMHRMHEVTCTFRVTDCSRAC